MPYEFLEEIAVADIAFKAWGRDLEEVFVAASDALMNVMVDNLESIKFRESRPLQLENSSIEMLLFDFLQEFLYYKDAEQLVLRVSQIRITGADDKWALEGQAQGEKLEPDRHPQRADVKAVTLHNFQLERTADGFAANVVLDI